MTRRILISILLIAAAACARRDSSMVALPETVADWRLAGSPAAGAANDRVTASYQGSPDIHLELTRLSSSTLAFSAVQSWRAEPGKLAFFKGLYFGIAEAPGANVKTLNRFVAEFQKSLPN